MAARKNRIHPDPHWVERIKQSVDARMIVNRLQAHVKGEQEMTATQITAGLGLLKKVLPDLAATDHAVEVTHNYVANLPELKGNLDEWQKSQTLQ